MKHYGLLMFRDDQDILAEVLEHNHRFFDGIFVLDGTEDNTATAAVVRRFSNIEFYMKDADLPPEYHPPRCGARQALLQEIQKQHGHEGWITVLHSDEIFIDADPREVAERADAEGCDHIIWANVPFFLHTSQEAQYKYDPVRSVVEQVTWAALPGFPENRQFKNLPGLRYDVRKHLQTIPSGASKKRPPRNPALRHYLYRSPEQMLANARDRIARGWQDYGRWMIERGSCFIDALPGFPIARQLKSGEQLEGGL